MTRKVRSIKEDQNKKVEPVKDNGLSLENYYSEEMNKAYMSVSQFKNFLSCEAKALALIEKRWVMKETPALLQGQYFETLMLEPEKEEEFKSKHPEMFLKDGKTLNANFKDIPELVRYIKTSPNNENFNEYVGDKFNSINQELVVGEIAGVPFKGLLDIYFPGDKIVDLKFMKDLKDVWLEEGFDKEFYSELAGRNISKVNFGVNWNYDLQLAVYQELIKQATGKQLPAYLAVVSKGIIEVDPENFNGYTRISDRGIYEFRQEWLDQKLQWIKDKAPRFQQIKNHEIEADSCGHCDYCIAHKSVEFIEDLTPDFFE